MHAHNIHDALVSHDLAESRGDLAHLSAPQYQAAMSALSKLMGGDSSALHAYKLVMDREVRMPVYRWDNAVRVVESLGKRARSLSMPAPLLEELRRETDDEGREFIVGRLLGAAPIEDGWSLLATVTPPVLSDRDPVVYLAPGACIPSDFVIDAMRCDGTTAAGHPCPNRKRVITFVVGHEDGRVMQLGSSCVKKVIGKAALSAWLVISELVERGNEVSGWGCWGVDAYAAYLASQAPEPEQLRGPVDLHTYVAAVVAHVRVHSFVSGREAYDTNARATGRLVWDRLQDATHEPTTDADRELARSIVDWASTLDRDECSRWGEPTYLASLGRAYGNTYVDRGGANMVASGITAYQRHLADQRRAQTSVNEYLPNVRPGDSVVLTLTVDRKIRSTWGLLLCSDEQGRKVTVQGSHDVQEGDTIRVMGKVRDFLTFRGIRETRINYAKVYTPGNESKTCKQRAREYATRTNTPVPQWACK